MARLSPQVLVRLARRKVEHALKWKHTEEHAPPIPDGAVTDDPLAEIAPLDVRLLQQLGFAPAMTSWRRRQRGRFP